MKANISLHSNSKGNLLKLTYEHDGVLYFAKTGRLQVRDFPENWGIEPIIEVICCELGKLLNVNVAEQRLDILHSTRLNKEFSTIINKSPDFRGGKSLIYLQALYAENERNIEFDKLCRNTDCGKDLVNLLAFDLIIMNEDRHNSNMAWLVQDDGTLQLSPIYDNGYSLLYDDISGMLKDYKIAAKRCLCNAPLYQENFTSAERLFVRMSKIYEPSLNLDVNKSEIYEAVLKVKDEYEKLIRNDEVNNIPIADEWWERVAEFVEWRVGYVRDLRDSVEE